MISSHFQNDLKPVKRKKNNNKKHAGNSAFIEPLSPRVLYSVDIFGLGGDIGLSDETDLELALAFDNPLEPKPKQTEVVFVDTTVADYQQIIDSLTSNSDQHTEYVVYALSATQSITDVDEALNKHANLSAIHFITHGSDANFRLGSSIINAQTLTQYSDNLNHWGAALAENGDILFYGCNLAETSEGRQLISNIANATGADVGASDNRTGHASQDADWQLEYAVGEIDIDQSKIANLLNNWESHLAPITVTTNIDSVDAPNLFSVDALLADPGPDSAISLREAVIASNSNPDEQVIQLASTTYTLDAPFDVRGGEYYGDLNITNPLIVQGNGAATTIDGNDASRVLSYFNAGNSALYSLTITNGNTLPDALTNGSSGGGISAIDTDLNIESVNILESRAKVGGGLFIQNGYSTLLDVKISNNVANSQGGFQGGGLFNDSGTTLTSNTTFSENFTNHPSNGGDGGGAFVNGLLAIDSTTFWKNSSDEGGALYINGTARAADASFIQNSANATGGAVYVNGRFELERGLIEDNQAAEGAGLFNRGTAIIQDSTLAYNSADAGTGGAVRTENPGSTTEIVRSTIAYNSASAGSSAIFAEDGNVQVQSSIVTSNNGTDNIHPNVLSNGFNLTSAPFSVPDSSDISGLSAVDIGLASFLTPVQPGSDLKVLKLNSDSIAINAGELIGTENSQLITDAAGRARNSAIDIGAYEYPQAASDVILYWGDVVEDNIQRFIVSTGQHQRIIDTGINAATDLGYDSTTDQPVNLEIDPENGQLYWNEYNTVTLTGDSTGIPDIGNLNTASLSGNLGVQNLATGLSQPLGLAIDTANERLFVSENSALNNSATDAILEYSFDGNLLGTTITDAQTPIGFISDLEYRPADETLLWTDTGIADNGTHQELTNIAVRSLDSTGIVSTLANDAFGLLTWEVRHCQEGSTPQQSNM